MIDAVLTAVSRALAAGEPTALATVVRTWQSAPLPAGTVMSVTASGEVAGSVSGGCVESAVCESAQDVLRTGAPRTERYGASHTDALAAGLLCGGEIQVFIEPLGPRHANLVTGWATALRAGEPVAVATVVHGSDRQLGTRLVVTPERVLGDLEPDRLLDKVTADCRALVAVGGAHLHTYGETGERNDAQTRVLVNSSAAPPRLIIVGAVDFAEALVVAAQPLGYRVSLVDARPAFTSAARFPAADEVVVRWPSDWLAEQELGPRDALCVLTHDAKFDVPVLQVALRTPVGYLGAMGSRRTHEDRRRRLLEVGVSPEEAQRIHSPIGLDIGAATPAETAVSILAEIVRARRGGKGVSLRDTEGPIHARATSDQSVNVTD